MSRSCRAGVVFRILIVAAIAACAHISAGSSGDPPNPYRAIEDWGAASARCPMGAGNQRRPGCARQHLGVPSQ